MDGRVHGRGERGEHHRAAPPVERRGGEAAHRAAEACEDGQRLGVGERPCELHQHEARRGERGADRLARVRGERPVVQRAEQVQRLLVVRQRGRGAGGRGDRAAPEGVAAAARALAMRAQRLHRRAHEQPRERRANLARARRRHLTHGEHEAGAQRAEHAVPVTADAHETRAEFAEEHERTPPGVRCAQLQSHARRERLRSADERRALKLRKKRAGWVEHRWPVDAVRRRGRVGIHHRREQGRLQVGVIVGERECGCRVWLDGGSARRAERGRAGRVVRSRVARRISAMPWCAVDNLSGWRLAGELQRERERPWVHVDRQG
mmetsp:Transcript_11506/g.36419  ORF Transcript_11506/g.36419 Transcript_11506/m.36419 type:complete len:321 (+) Transcript_11506:451-1413(+)